MESETNKPSEESLRFQLVEIHNRAQLHANRLWQLPFSYIGIIGLSFSLIDKTSNKEPLFLLFLFYAVLGLIILMAMWGALEGIKRALVHMIRIERELYLTETTKIRVLSQFIPYFMINLLGILGCSYLSIKFR